ncbi:PXMP2/4 family protein 4-like [Vigna unguiculata]|uniref:PXMP2/4 family protein 4-like n=1 Tax=Vigna unguiculata TaxID=3917 RepID=UPI001017179D|nr:PXMP2/4 family protein 4-like [Vigna unguiculata]
MSSAFRMNSAKISHVMGIQRHFMLVNHVVHPVKTSSFLFNKVHSKPFIRLPHFIRKPREYETSLSLFSSSFCSSSSSSSAVAASLSKVGFVSWYLGMIKSWPILTKSVTSSLIYIGADLSSQTIVREPSEAFDFMRTSRMAGYGMIVLGPSLHFWYNFVSKLFPRRDIFSTLKKMVIGQTIYGPAMTVIFLSLNAHLQGETGSEIVARLKRDFLSTMLGAIMYWPICDFITFKFIPVNLQPLITNSFSYLWTVYMTYMASLEKAA